MISPDLIAERILKLLQVSAAGDGAQLKLIVSNAAYGLIFLKLARNLAPTVTRFGQMEISSAWGGNLVELQLESRRGIAVIACNLTWLAEGVQNRSVTLNLKNHRAP